MKITVAIYLFCFAVPCMLVAQQETQVPASPTNAGAGRAYDADVVDRLAAYRKAASVNCERNKKAQLIASRKFSNDLHDNLALTNDVTSHTFGAYWMVGSGYSSTLIVRNKDTENPVKAKVVLLSHDGKEEANGEMSIAANGVARLSLADILKTKEGTEHWGSVMLEFIDGSASRTMGNIVLENEKEGLIFDVPLMGGFRFDTQNALYANWWFPDQGTDGVIVLSNLSEQKVIVSPSLLISGTEIGLHPTPLESRETKKLSIRRLLQDSGLDDTLQGGVALRYTGPAHALSPILMLSNSKTGFSLLSAFNAKHEDLRNEHTVHWQFSNLVVSPSSQLGFDPKETLVAYALLTNGTQAKITPQLTAHLTNSDGTEAHQVQLQVQPLDPLETRLINLSQLLGVTTKARDSSPISLTTAHPGAPGDIAFTVFSLGKNKDFVLQAHGNVRPSKTVDSSYWDIAGSLSALLTVNNPSTIAVEAKAVVSFQDGNKTGTYTLPLIHVPAGGSRIFNLKKILLAGSPDATGKTIPAGTNFGTVTLEVTDKLNTGLITGGSSTFDPKRGGYGGGEFPPNCDFCDLCEDCIQPTDTGGDCEPSCSDPSCCPPDPPPGIPDHLMVLSDVAGPMSSFGVVCTLPNISPEQRILTYEVLDFYDNGIAGQLFIAEQFTSISSNTCLNGTPVTATSCQRSSSGGFVDLQSVGCNTVGGSCGFTATNQQIVWCSSSGNVVIGTPGTDVVHNDFISVGGSLHFIPGTMIFP